MSLLLDTINEIETSLKLCDICSHAYDAHHAFGCDGNAKALREHWAPLYALPGYDQTRETVYAYHASAPKPCECLALPSRFMSVSE